MRWLGGRGHQRRFRARADRAGARGVRLPAALPGAARQRRWSTPSRPACRGARSAALDASVGPRLRGLRRLHRLAALASAPCEAHDEPHDLDGARPADRLRHRGLRRHGGLPGARSASPTASRRATERAMSGLSLAIGLRRDARPHRPAHAGRARHAGDGQRRLHLPSRDGAVFLNYMKSTPYFLFSNYTLSVIPLFILMGAFAERSGLSRTCSGPRAPSSATAAAAGDGGDRRLHGVRRHLRLVGRDDGHLRPGRAAGTAPLPLRAGLRDRHDRRRRHARHPDPALGHPRRLRDLDRAEHRQAVPGGADPGLIATLFYCVAIAWIVRRNPDLAPPHPSVPRPERLRPARRGSGRCWSSRCIVVGGIYGGVFTPTEGAAVGAVAMLAHRPRARARSAGAEFRTASSRPPRPRR